MLFCRLVTHGPLCSNVATNLAGSVVVTLLCAGVAESGENEAEALENLAWFINNLIEEREANPNQPLGKRLAKQIEILQDTFQRVGTNQ